MTKIQALHEELEQEIRRINETAGETVFNPTALDLLRSITQDIHQAHVGMGHALEQARRQLDKIPVTAMPREYKAVFENGRHYLETLTVLMAIVNKPA